MTGLRRFVPILLAAAVAACAAQKTAKIGPEAIRPAAPGAAVLHSPGATGLEGSPAAPSPAPGTAAAPSARPEARAEGGPPPRAAAPILPLPGDDIYERRRQEVLSKVGSTTNPEAGFVELTRPDDYDGPATAKRSVHAYATGLNLQAVLLAQAAYGADPGNPARRRLLDFLSETTGLLADEEALLPLGALIHLELRRAEKAFFEERLGDAVQACRRTLLLDPGNVSAWVRLGSTHYALGENQRANSAYNRALSLDPTNAEVLAFLAEKGWNRK